MNPAERRARVITLSPSPPEACQLSGRRQPHNGAALAASAPGRSVTTGPRDPAAALPAGPPCASDRAFRTDQAGRHDGPSPTGRARAAASARVRLRGRRSFSRSSRTRPRSARARTSARISCPGWASRRARVACGRRRCRGRAAARAWGRSAWRWSTRSWAARASGPVACNCAAPDDGNMLVLEKVGTAEQKERWLQPIVDGRVRSAIVMTEPGARLGLRPRRHDADPGRAPGRPLRRARPQVVHHRGRGCGPLHPAGAHLRRPAARAHRHAVPPGPARLAHPAPDPDHGPGGAWRALRARVRRARGAAGERAPGRGAGHEGDPDPPRHRAAHALHALARHGAPGAGDRPALYRASGAPSGSFWPRRRACRACSARPRWGSRSAAC